MGHVDYVGSVKYTDQLASEFLALCQKVRPDVGKCNVHAICRSFVFR